MALWGSEIAQEDDAEKAIRAAIAMQAELNRLASQLDIPLSGRIGLNTGEVLLGVVGTTGEFTAMGDSVNLASRIEHAAPSGGILISHNTFRHVRGVFEVVTQPMLRVKGKAEAIQTYLVLRESSIQPSEPNRIAGIATPMIGRDREVRRLRAIFREVAQQRRAATVRIVGETGLGKSRMLYEFARDVADSDIAAHTLRVRALRQHQSMSYRLIRDLIARWFDLHESDPPATTRTRFIAGIRLLVEEEAEQYADTIGRLIGYDVPDSPYLAGLREDPQQLSRLAVLYLSRLMLRMMSDASLIVLLDDIQWADPYSIDLLSQIRQRCADAPLLLIACARPSQAEVQLSDSGGGIVMQLGPLEDEESVALVEALLGTIDLIPGMLRDTIIQHADGNPYYIEELIKMLIEDGAVERIENRWQFQPDRGSVHVPATLTSLLQARIDRLGPAERRALESAAVIGRVFWESCVVRLQGVGARNGLAALEQRGLIFQQPGSAFAGEREYIFKHVLLRDVAYEQVMRRRRPSMHRQVASWLERTAKQHGRLDEYLPLIAEQYEQAGMPEQAAQRLEQVAVHALALHAYREAIGHLERALEQASDPEHEAHLLKLLGDAHAGEYQHQAAIDAYQRCLSLAEAYEQHTLIAAAQIGIGQVAREQGAYATARAAFHTAQRISTAPQQRMVIEHELAQIAASAGDWQSSITHAEQGLLAARQAEQRTAEADLLATLGVAIFQSSDQHAVAQKHLEQSLALCQTSGDLRGMIVARIALADLAEALGRNAEARQHYLACLELLEQSKDQRVHALVWQGLGEMYCRQGDLQQASHAYEQSLASALIIDDPWRTAACLVALGDLARYLHDHQTADDHYQHSLMVSQPIGAARHIAAALRGLGQLADRQQRIDQATTLYQESLVAARNTGERDQEIRTLTALILHQLMINDPLAALDTAHKALQGAEALNGWPTKTWLLSAVARLAIRLGDTQHGALWGSAAFVGATHPEIGATLDLLHHELTPTYGEEWYLQISLPRGNYDTRLSGFCKAARSLLPEHPIMSGA
ncbi:MAG: hypothetical protein OHK0050_26810 [Roseiflexaceae bacterium]